MSDSLVYRKHSSNTVHYFAYRMYTCTVYENPINYANEQFPASVQSLPQIRTHAEVGVSR